MNGLKEEIKLENNKIRFIYANDTASTPAHWHDAVEVLYVYGGSFTQQLDDRIFTIQRGDIVIVWANQIHSTFSNLTGDGDIFCFLFRFNHLDLSLIDISFRDKFWDEFISNCIEQIKWEHENGTQDSGACYMVESYLYQMLAYIAKNKEKLPLTQTKTGINREMIGRAFSYIDDNYMQNISLQEIAAHTHLSIPQFCRVFKKATGYTFLKYLNLYRVNKSLQFLNENESIRNTAGLCGFDNQNTYIRLFKQFKGLTPHQYKRLYY